MAGIGEDRRQHYGPIAFPLEGVEALAESVNSPVPLLLLISLISPENESPIPEPLSNSPTILIVCWPSLESHILPRKYMFNSLLHERLLGRRRRKQGRITG